MIRYNGYKDNKIKDRFFNKRAVALFLSDSVAMLSFFTVTGILNEKYIAGMEWSEVMTARIIGAPLMILTARFYGIWRDLIMNRFGCSNHKGIRAFLLDTFSSLSFNIPWYAAILAMGGASLTEIIKGCIGAFIILLVAGRPYGLWLDFIRSKFKVYF